MVDITTRSGKGSALTHAELDANFTNLKTAVETNVTDIANAGGVTVYATIDNLPLSSLSAGDLAYVSGTNRLYLSNGTGWYNIALVNQTPTISGNEATYTLSSDGTATVVTLTGTDPEGIPITWSATTSGTTSAATVTNSDNVFTITPSTNTANQGTLVVTFRASDGINIGTASSEFSLSFVSALWKDVTLSIGTSGTNSLANNTFIDRSTNASTVTTSGSPVQTAFHPYLDNWSVEFDGTGDYSTLSETATSLLPETSNTTFECWVNTVSSGDMAIFSNFNSSSPFNGVEFGLNNGYQTFWSQGTFLNRPTTNLGVGTINDGQWHHLAWVITNSGTTLTTYVDGVQNYTSSITASTTGNATQSIGSDSNSTRGRYFNGHITNLRFVKGTAVYTSAFTPPTEKLTAITNTVLLTCQSNRLIDNSTNSYTITPAGDVKISAFNPFGQESEYALSQNIGSMYASGAGNKITGDTSDVAFGTGDFTIEFWVYPSSLYNYQCFITTRTNNSGYADAFHIGCTSTGASSVYSNVDQAAIPAGSYKAGQWHHVVVVRESSDLSYFVNGARLGNSTWTGNIAKTPFGIGGFPTTDQEYLTGYISDIRITKGTARYSASSTTLTVPTSPVGNTNASLYLPMDNAGIFDKTGTNTLTLVGDTSTSTTQTKYATTSMYFDGTGDWITWDSSTQGFYTNDFTVEFWLNLNSLSSINGIFQHGQDNGAFAIHVNTNGTVRVLENAVASLVDSSISLSTGNWHHIAVVQEGTNGTLYIDGTSRGTFTKSTDWVFNNATSYIGARYFSSTAGQYPMNGYIENFQIINGSAKYTANFTPPSQEQGRFYQEES